MDPELADAVADFLGMFELVFDGDWEVTRACIRDPQFLISGGGTFIHPDVEDESNNWANRGALLASYRRLKDLLGPRGGGGTH
jgi:hypothetical protein